MKKYTVYEVSILHDGEVEKARGNWAGVIHKIYDTLGEENASLLTSNIQSAQTEMFFGNWVKMSFGIPHYKISIQVIS